MIEVKADRVNRGLDLLQKWLDNNFTQDALVRASLLLSVDIRDRVEQTGISADGSKFSPYSTKPILVGAKSFEQKKAFETVLKQAKNASKDSPLHWVTISKGGKKYRLIVLPGGYKRIRELEGRQVAHKSFNRTAFMWDGFGIKGSQKNVVFIGGKTPDSQNKINWNSAREKENIIAASEKETTKLANYVNIEVQKKIKEYFS